MKRLVIGLILVLLTAWTLGRGVTSHAAGPADQHVFTVMVGGDSACDPTSTHFNAGQGDKQGAMRWPPLISCWPLIQMPYSRSETISTSRQAWPSFSPRTTRVGAGSRR